MCSLTTTTAMKSWNARKMASTIFCPSRSSSPTKSRSTSTPSKSKRRRLKSPLWAHWPQSLRTGITISRKTCLKTLTKRRSLSPTRRPPSTCLTTTSKRKRRRTIIFSWKSSLTRLPRIRTRRERLSTTLCSRQRSRPAASGTIQKVKSMSIITRLLTRSRTRRNLSLWWRSSRFSKNLCSRGGKTQERTKVSWASSPWRRKIA